MGRHNQGELVDNPASEGVTLWGGGTYAQAIAAAAGGGRIPILLTKDGIQSMIGVFTILEDKAIIKTNNGTIVMDDDEGISVLDSQGLERVLVTPTTINEHVPTTHALANFELAIIKNYPASEIESSYTHSDEFKAERTDIVHCTMNIPVNLSGETTYGSSVGYIAVSGAKVKNLRFQVIDKATGTTIHTKQLVGSGGVAAPVIPTSGLPHDYNNTFVVNEEFRVSKDKTYKVQVVFDYEIYTDSGSAGHGNANLSIGEGDSDTTKIKIMYTSMCAYLCSDGLAVMANSDTQFRVDATADNKLGIYAKGLPMSEPNVTGQLYIKNVSGSKVIAIK